MVKMSIFFPQMNVSILKNKEMKGGPGQIQVQQMQPLALSRALTSIKLNVSDSLQHLIRSIKENISKNLYGQTDIPIDRHSDLLVESLARD